MNLGLRNYPSPCLLHTSFKTLLADLKLIIVSPQVSNPFSLSLSVSHIFTSLISVFCLLSDCTVCISGVLEDLELFGSLILCSVTAPNSISSMELSLSSESDVSLQSCSTRPRVCNARTCLNKVNCENVYKQWLWYDTLLNI